MPRAAVGLVGGDRSLRQGADNVGTATGQPVGVREHDHRLRVGGARGDDALVHGDHDLGQVPEGRRSGEQRVRIDRARKLLDAVEQCADVALTVIVIDRGRERRGGIGKRGGHDGKVHE